MTDSLRVQIARLHQDLPIPSYAHPGDAGLDLHAAESLTLKPGDRAPVRTGLRIAIPDGYAGYVQPRSGLALRRGVGILNSPGLVDSGYRGEIIVTLINLDKDTPVHVKRGDRIAQLVILPAPRIELEEVDDLPDSERGEAGFGSSG